MSLTEIYFTLLLYFILYLEYYLCAQCTFFNIKPKMCFNVTIDEDCIIISVFKCRLFKVYLNISTLAQSHILSISLVALQLKCIKHKISFSNLADFKYSSLVNQSIIAGYCL